MRLARFTSFFLVVATVVLHAPLTIASPVQIDWPNAEKLLRVLSLRDANTRVVVCGVMVLGLVSGVVGSFMVLRKRALIGDAISHATLPGICVAFIVMTVAFDNGKYLPGLLLGAAVAGLLGVGTLIVIRRFTRIAEDAALGITLSVFFGFGIALRGVIQKMPQGNQAGLENFIYGRTASMVRSDVAVIAVVAGAALLVCVALYKEFKLLSFDAAFARAQGWPVRLIDLTMMTLVTAVTVAGLQAVGLVLIIAMLIIPAAAARFWTDRLSTMILLAGGIGAVCGYLGAAVSALIANLPAGALIVIVSAAVFLLSMLIGTRRGLIRKWREQRRLGRDVAEQHTLRTIYELLESRGVLDSATAHSVSATDLMSGRAWSSREMRRSLRVAERRDAVESVLPDQWRLTESGAIDAARIARNHRLWELYLIHYADIAPSHVDRGADMIEHVLAPNLVAELERHLDRDGRIDLKPVPDSPHVLADRAEAEATP